MSIPVFSDEYYINEALKEAKKAYKKNEVPVGAIIVCKNRIIARAHNLTEILNDVTAHAEMQAFTAAANYLGAKYLDACSLYVTLEPCIMCAGAAYWTQIGKIVYGSSDEKKGFSKFNIKILHPKTVLKSRILEHECAEILKGFFKSKR